MVYGSHLQHQNPPLPNLPPLQPGMEYHSLTRGVMPQSAAGNQGALLVPVLPQGSQPLAGGLYMTPVLQATQALQHTAANHPNGFHVGGYPVGYSGNHSLDTF